MNLEFVRNFVKLTKYKSFSALANDLSISQSTLSHQISQLESELGVKLIDRTTRKFNITKEGRTFLNYAEKIIALYDSCLQDLSKLKVEFVEDIVITASTLPGSHFLPKYIANFKEENANVNFKVLINNSEKSLNLLKKNLADFAGVGSFMEYDKNNFDVIKIGEDNLKFICSTKHKLIEDKRNKVKFENLIKYPFITREIGSGTREVIDQQFKGYTQLNISLEISDNDSIISAVSNSNYISILSEHIAKKAEDAGLVKVLDVEEFPIIAKRDVFFIKLKEKSESGLKKKFWDYLKI